MIKNYADHSANERTFLAWVRTAIAVVGFGLGAARIGSAPGNVWSEIFLLASGGLVVLIAYLRMRSLHQRICSGREELDQTALSIDTLMLFLIIALFFMLGMFAWHTLG